MELNHASRSLANSSDGRLPFRSARSRGRSLPGECYRVRQLAICPLERAALHRRIERRLPQLQAAVQPPQRLGVLQRTADELTDYFADTIGQRSYCTLG